MDRYNALNRPRSGRPARSSAGIFSFDERGAGRGPIPSTPGREVKEQRIRPTHGSPKNHSATHLAQPGPSPSQLRPSIQNNDQCSGILGNNKQRGDFGEAVFGRIVGGSPSEKRTQNDRDPTRRSGGCVKDGSEPDQSCRHLDFWRRHDCGCPVG